MACFNYQPDLLPFPPLAFLPAGGVGCAGFSGACGGGGVSSLVAGSAAGAADAAAAGGAEAAAAGSVFKFGQGCSLGDELMLADQELGHGTSPAS